MEELPLFNNTPQVFTVLDINRMVSGLVKSSPVLQSCWVSGEVSKVSIPGSGHCYFSLKDANAEMKAVVWRSRLTQDIRELLKQGNAIEAHGSIDVYDKGGYYQLNIDAVRPKGRGNIYEELERLRKKLAAEGLFDESRKRPLPWIPRSIGLVTSPSAAAKHDVLTTLGNRWPLSEVWFSPASVQGDGAPAELIAALKKLYALKPDVVILARGGGSAEDLWCFNDEGLVRTVAASPVPIITGVGHDVDTTLVDYAADVRAATPTGAAVLAVPALEDVVFALDQLDQRLEKASESLMQQFWQALDMIEKRLMLQSPEVKIFNEKRTLEQLELRLKNAQSNYFLKQKTTLDALEKQLLSLNPENIMKRGYAFVRQEDKVITSAAELDTGDRIRIRFFDGEKSAQID